MKKRISKSYEIVRTKQSHELFLRVRPASWLKGKEDLDHFGFINKGGTSGNLKATNNASVK